MTISTNQKYFLERAADVLYSMSCKAKSKAQEKELIDLSDAIYNIIDHEVNVED